MMKKFMTYIVVVSSLCGIAKTVVGAANCANSSGDIYTLTLAGDTTVLEGESLTFDITKNPSSTTLNSHTWTVTASGSPTEIIKAHEETISANNLSATVVFYWYPGSTPGEYTVTFDSGGTGTGCSKTKTVTCSMPEAFF